ncbi:type I DNA topoisomerase [Rickettsiales endosymbiont of Trichoplax sp. H2]|uniref:type I DNA topoisomerase n=1 Tax=Rickettsiales endosymbiont of Trichoplax sp. H2 TaxID=2021221 RepID=UPI0012B21CBE|nr:type I DNA topoisomerase [Rickettsiales endosymbiont of Trichoplax sp. H2]MSO13910.1 DNA topoisomerase 1 [Rickettsiales endosymbiont of Trichoplax sp. H2]
MKLLIVESPAKAKTLEKYLGKDFKVISSYGHIRSLPSVRDAVEPENNFKITYKPIIRAKDTIKNLADNFKKAEIIYLATDPDREGEAISWHILETMKSKKSLNNAVNVKRIAFHEITKNAVINAINNPRELDKDLIHAQQARQALDYLVGFTLSPVLWRKLPGSKSAGRVQSVALKLLCERENERDKFKEQEYWTIDSIFSKNNKDSFSSQLHTYNGEKLEKFSINKENKAKDIIKNIKTLNYKVSSIKKKDIIRKPTAPFITSTLIQEASRKLNFSAKKTMIIAQKLYEGIQVKSKTDGLITYMRTDSVTISQEAIKNITSHIKSHYGSNYLPKNPILYKSKSKNAQEAHEAIRPTNFSNNPTNLKDFLDNDQYRLYELIWKRTIASQMANAKLESVTIEISSQNNKNIFKSTGSTIVFDGFYRVYKEGIDNEENEKKNNIPKLQEGDILNLDKITPNQHFTQPPPRYTEASLVKKMEELGIGRPSTYPKIISILVEREYAKILQKRFIPEAKGRLVDAFLNKFFDKYIDYDFTANLENDLDDVANGKKKWKEVLSNFWILFKNTSDKVLEIKNIDIINEVEKLLLDYIFNTTDKDELSKLRKCTNCKNGELGLKTGKFGAFIGCSNYPECSYKRTLFQEENTENKNEKEKVIGVDEITQSEILLKKGPYGFYLEKEVDGKKKRASLPAKVSPDNINLEFACSLLNLPKDLGKHPTIKEDILVKIGRYGPYLECNKKFYALKNIDKINLELLEAVDLIDNYKPKQSKKRAKK